MSAFDEDDRSLEGPIATCAACGGELQPETQRGFRFGDRAALCFRCATERGGSYDEAGDRWIVPPDLRGLEPDYD
jgi:hypothetical protein